MAHVRRAPSGKGWEARFCDPHDRERSQTYSTRREAEQFLARQSADVQRGDFLDPRLGKTRFDEWAEDWLTTTVHLKPNTWLTDESILRQRVLPVFGGLRIASIEQVDVRRFVAALAEAGDQPGAIRNTSAVLRSVFNTALGSGAIRANPCAGVRMPRSAPQEMLFLEPPQVLDLAAAITGRTARSCSSPPTGGSGAGELGALRVGRLDLLRGTVDVRESLADVKGQLVFGPTKTYAHRTVRIPPFLRDVLGEHLAGGPTQADDLVCTGPTGAPLRHNLSTQALQAGGAPSRAPGAAPLPRPAPHLRRHPQRPGRPPPGDHGAARPILDRGHARPVRPPVPEPRGRAHRRARGDLPGVGA